MIRSDIEYSINEYKAYIAYLTVELMDARATAAKRLDLITTLTTPQAAQVEETPTND
jgi:hypothetical protein